MIDPDGRPQPRSKRVKLRLDVDNSIDPRARVRAAQEAAETICREVGLDASEATMMLLTAAARIALREARSVNHAPAFLSKALAQALVCAARFDKPGPWITKQ